MTIRRAIHTMPKARAAKKKTVKKATRAAKRRATPQSELDFGATKKAARNENKRSAAAKPKSGKPTAAGKRKKPGTSAKRVEPSPKRSQRVSPAWPAR